MKILHVNTAHDFRGGERQTLFLVLGQWRDEVDCRVVTQPGSRLSAELLAGGFPADRIHEIRMRGEVHPMAVGRLTRLCRRFAVDILHLHTAHAHALGVLAARFTRVTTVVSRRVDYPMSRGVFSRMKYERADAYIAISEAVRRILLADGMAAEKLHLVHSGIDVPSAESLAAGRLERASLLNELDLPLQSSIVLNVGNLVGHKGQEILPHAARILDSGSVILIAGEGPLRGELEAAIAQHDVAERVRLLGHREDLPRLYAAASVYVQPSTTEGLGTAMLDAMAWELPVIATYAGGIPEAITDQENGILLSGRNPYLMGEALKKLLTDPVLAGRMGGRGREIAVERFSRDQMVAGTARVYDAVRSGLSS